MDGAGGGYPAHPRIHGARRESGCSPGRYRSRFLWKCSSPSRWHGGPQESFVAVGPPQTRRQVSVESRSLHAEKQRKDGLPPSRFSTGFVIKTSRLSCSCEADHTTFGKSCENLNCLFYEYGKAM